MNKKTIIILTCLCVVIAIMEISGLPGILLKIRVADVDPYILPLMVNFVIIGIVAFFVVKLFKIEFNFGFTTKGLKKGLKRFALPGILAGILAIVISSLAFGLGHLPGMLGMGTEKPTTYGYQLSCIPLSIYVHCPIVLPHICAMKPFP